MTDQRNVPDLADRVLALTARIAEEDNDFDLASAGWTWWQEAAEELAEAAAALAREVRCDHEVTSTYLRPGGHFEEECADCGEIVETHPPLPADREHLIGRVGQTSLPGGRGPTPAQAEEEGPR